MIHASILPQLNLLLLLVCVLEDSCLEWLNHPQQGRVLLHLHFKVFYGTHEVILDIMSGEFCWLVLDVPHILLLSSITTSIYLLCDRLQRHIAWDLWFRQPQRLRFDLDGLTTDWLDTRTIRLIDRMVPVEVLERLHGGWVVSSFEIKCALNITLQNGITYSVGWDNKL